jgi:hypothetical protein
MGSVVASICITGRKAGLEASADEFEDGSLTSGVTNVKELDRCFSGPDRMGK